MSFKDSISGTPEGPYRGDQSNLESSLWFVEQLTSKELTKGVEVTREDALQSARNLLNEFERRALAQDEAVNELYEEPGYEELLETFGMKEDENELHTKQSETSWKIVSLGFEFTKGDITPESVAAMRIIIAWSYTKAKGYFEFMEKTGGDMRETFPEAFDPKEDHNEGTDYEKLLTDSVKVTAYINKLYEK